MNWNPFKKKPTPEDVAAEPAGETAAAAASAPPDNDGDSTDPLAQPQSPSERASLLREHDGVSLERVEIWGAGGHSDTFLRLSVARPGDLATAMREALLGLPEQILGFRDLLVSPAGLCAALEAPRATLADLLSMPTLQADLRSADLLSLLRFAAGLPGLLGAYNLRLEELVPEDFGLRQPADRPGLEWQFCGLDKAQLSSSGDAAMPSMLPLIEAGSRLLDLLTAQAERNGFAYSQPALRELRELLPVLGADSERIFAALDSLRPALQMTGATDVGQRRKHNEDAYLIFSLDQLSMAGARFTLAAIADGMGGHASGEVASSLALDLLRMQLSQLLLMPRTKAHTAAPVGKQLEQIVPAISTVLQERAALEPSMGGMGTTLIGFVLLEPQSTIDELRLQPEGTLFWAGDSRAYLLGPAGIRRLSSDHSYVQTLVDGGQITDEEAFTHPQKNIITRCLGAGGNDARPQYLSFAPAPGEILLLCSDGLSDALRDSEIQAVAAQVCAAALAEDGTLRGSAQAFLAELGRALIEAANTAGGPDNITVLLVTG